MGAGGVVFLTRDPSSRKSAEIKVVLTKQAPRPKRNGKKGEMEPAKWELPKGGIREADFPKSEKINLDFAKFANPQKLYGEDKNRAAARVLEHASRATGLRELKNECALDLVDDRSILERLFTLPESSGGVSSHTAETHLFFNKDKSPPGGPAHWWLLPDFDGKIWQRVARQNQLLQPDRRHAEEAGLFPIQEARAMVRPDQKRVLKEAQEKFLQNEIDGQGLLLDQRGPAAGAAPAGAFGSSFASSSNFLAARPAQPKMIMTRQDGSRKIGYAGIVYITRSAVDGQCRVALTQQERVFRKKKYVDWELPSGGIRTDADFHLRPIPQIWNIPWILILSNPCT